MWPGSYARAAALRPFSWPGLAGLTGLVQQGVSVENVLLVSLAMGMHKVVCLSQVFS